jgi:hypothetical protein
MLHTPSKSITGRRSVAEKYLDPTKLLLAALPGVEVGKSACLLRTSNPCTSAMPTLLADLALCAYTKASEIVQSDTIHQLKLMRTNWALGFLCNAMKAPKVQAK